MHPTAVRVRLALVFVSWSIAPLIYYRLRFHPWLIWTGYKLFVSIVLPSDFCLSLQCSLETLSVLFIDFAPYFLAGGKISVALEGKNYCLSLGQHFVFGVDGAFNSV